ncbi:hypothetical protein Vadar_008276 [Vaccinium darrowii]|uniref:Uncharacterized protein n=1 Tax=Vaccinium darrowii TaxID=229202 RepID=A0ACB7ZB72_9ERIC|nr:hypothetical protein Vadar_008276 [Vaccinium darrowii]
MPCIRTPDTTKDYNDMKDVRKWWEAWDLRILILYILIAQLYLVFYGRLRRRSKSVLMMIVSVWLLYLFSDLLATIALGKLSNIKVHDDKDDSTKVTGNSTKAMSNQNNTMGEQSLRVMWAPLILFYLGGPDTITVLRVDENKLWVRHLIGFLTQGLRTAYALIVTWHPDLVLSLLALLVFIPGIIKYGERVWVIRSISKDYAGFDQLGLPKIDEISATRPNAELVLLAHSWFRTLRPYNAGYMSKEREVRPLLARFRESVKTNSVDAFKLIHIELGMIYDLLFSKVGTIFTVWGSILRFLSFTLIVSVLVIYITWDKPPGHLEGDHIITIILLAGAIFLEISGIVVQLVSDWAMVWACKNGSKWAKSVLFLHEFRISKSQRWSGVMGQFSLGEFCKNYKPTVCNRTWECLFGREKMLKIFCSQESPNQDLKDLIICHLREKLWGGAAIVDTSKISTERVVDVGTSQTSTQIIEEVDKLQTSAGRVTNVKLTPGVKRGEWTLLRYDVEQQFKWSIEEEFGQSIFIWHVATQVCYEFDYPKFFGDEVKLKTVKILSDYMMYLLVACPYIFPFCNKYDNMMQDYADMKKIFRGVTLEGVENERDTTNITLAKTAQRLVEDMKGNPKRWDIMGSMWAEMLCYAARECPLKNHIQELRRGDEFLTHVWLLLLHFGIPKKLEGSTYSLDDEDEKEDLSDTEENGDQDENCCGDTCCC